MCLLNSLYAVFFMGSHLAPHDPSNHGPPLNATITRWFGTQSNVTHHWIEWREKKVKKKSPVNPEKIVKRTLKVFENYVRMSVWPRTFWVGRSHRVLSIPHFHPKMNFMVGPTRLTSLTRSAYVHKALLNSFILFYFIFCLVLHF